MKNDTLGELVFKELKHAILSGVYSPGERLLYQKLTVRLGVSMTPLKDALLKLEQEGLVKNIARRGAFVTQLDERDITEYSQIRFSLEGLAVDLICQMKLVTNKSIKELSEINKQLLTSVNMKNAEDCIANDIRFHQSLVSYSENNRLVEMMQQFPLCNFLLLMGRGDKVIENGEIIFNDHEEIISALEKYDNEMVKTILRKNIFLPYNEIFEK